MLDEIFKNKIEIDRNFIRLKETAEASNQQQTNEVFSEKWSKYEKSSEKDKAYEFQKKWYLKLYGFESELELARFLSSKKYIFDAGCGLGYKAKWFADLSPSSIVIGMDFSDACEIAAKNYEDTKNLFFIKGDIANTPFLDNSIDYVNCDQVIMHTEDPEATFSELTRITKWGGNLPAMYMLKKPCQESF